MVGSNIPAQGYNFAWHFLEWSSVRAIGILHMHNYCFQNHASKSLKKFYKRESVRHHQKIKFILKLRIGMLFWLKLLTP